MPGRYIAENVMKCQIEDSALKKMRARQNITLVEEPKSLGLLLDQEKAYERIILIYLKVVLLRFRFSPTIVDCIYNLMTNYASIIIALVTAVQSRNECSL